MKIESLDTQMVYAGMRNWVIVRLRTTDGLEGLGEATLEGREGTVAEAVSELGRYLLGQDAIDVTRHWHRMYQTFWKGGPVLASALSGVDIALWDLLGKHLEVPIYQLLGGKVRDHVVAYTHVRKPGVLTEEGVVDMWWEEGTAEGSAQVAQRLVDRGFRALKTGPFVEHGEQRDPQWLDRTVTRAEAIRNQIGPDIQLMVDLHGRLEPWRAIRFTRQVEPLDLTWIEEPVPPENLQSLAKVAAATSLPLAAGERNFSRASFLDLISSGLVDFVQPDVAHCGGISELRNVAAIAGARDVRVAPHNPLGPVATAAAIQVAAAMPEVEMLEVKIDDVPWRETLTTRPVVPVDGLFTIPEGPGLGIEVDWQVAETHPYRPQDLPRSTNPDGSPAIW